MKIIGMRLLWATMAGLLPWLAGAQSTLDRRPMFTMVTGLHYANQHLRHERIGYDQLGGFHTAIGLEKPVTRRLTLTALAGYTQLGSQNAGFVNNVSEKMDYLTFGIRAAEYLPVGGSDLYLSIGPQVGMGLQGRRLSAEGQVLVQDLFSEEGYSKNDFGLSGALGIKLPFGTSMELGWYLGLTNVYKNTFMSVYNNSLQISIGHTLGWSRFKSNRKR